MWGQPSKEDSMKTKTLAIAGSIAALSFAAAPVAAIAATSHQPARTVSQLDRSRDARGVRHVDRTPDRASSIDRTSTDRSRDIGDR